MCTSLAKGQVATPEELEMLRTAVVKRIGPYSELGDKPVFQMKQDRFGFMWISTIFHLYRYDGAEFVDYTAKFNRPEDEQDMLVHSMLEDSAGQLWIGTVDGLFRYDREGDEMVRMEGVPSARSIGEGAFGTICILDRFDQFHVYRKEGEALMQETSSSLADLRTSGVVINTFSCDNDSNIWLVSKGGRIYQFEATPDDIALARGEPLQISSERNFNVTCSLADGKTLWVGTTMGGIFRIDLRTGETVNFLKQNARGELGVSGRSARWLEKDGEGRVWVGMTDGGLNLYLPELNTFRRLGFTRGVVLEGGNRSPICVEVDNGGRLWIGTLDLGVFIVHTKPSLFRYESIVASNGYDHSGDYVDAYLKSRNGDEWVAIRRAGLLRKEGANWVPNHLKPKWSNEARTIRAYTIAEDPEGSLWVGSAGQGIHILDIGRDEYRHLSDPRLTHASCDAIFFQGDVAYVGLLERILKVDYKTGEVIGEIDGLYNRVTIIKEDQNQRLWIGSRGGLCIYDLNSEKLLLSKGETSRFKHRIAKGWVSDIDFQPDGTVWIATLGEGIFRLDSDLNMIREFRAKEGLPSESVGTFQFDDDGIMWMSTRVGIVALDPKTGQHELFQEEDGLTNNHFTKQKSARRADGSFLFPSKMGLLQIHPRYHSRFEEPLEAKLTGIRILDREVEIAQKDAPLRKNILLAERLRLKHTESVFTLEYSAMNYERMGKTWFRHRILGNEWSPPSLDRSVTLANLPAGEHVFQVMASNRASGGDGPVRSLAVTVLPSVWATWWALSLMSLCSGGIIFGLIQLRTRSLNRRRKVLEDLVDARTKTIEERNKEILGQNLELEKHRSHLESMVEERTTDLRKAKDMAEESDKLKSAFLANMSHEIRTPLNSLVGFSQVLMDPSLYDESDMKEFSGIIQQNANSLTHLIDDILDISKLEAGQITVVSEPFDLVDTCRTLFTQYKARLARDGSEVNMGLELNGLEALLIESDPNRLRQILVNFLDNAVKFTKRGSITIKLSELADEAIVAICDTGIGISAEDQKHVFDRFRKLEVGNAEVFRGAGLGLAISSKLAELIHANIELESELGKGTRFMLHVPTRGTGTWSFNEGDAGQKRHFDWKGRSLLVAEDEDANFRLIELITKPTGVTLKRATNGQRAVEIVAAEQSFDLVLMDLHMPGLNGLEAIDRLKANFPELPVIAHTAHTLLYDRDTMLERGFDGYVSKPINTDQTLEALDEFLGSKV